MAYIYTTPNLTEGIDSALVGVVTAVPSFIPMLLVFIWATILIAGSVSQRKLTGFMDFPQWATLSSVSVLLITLVLTMAGNLINYTVLTVVVAITILSGIWLFLDKNSREAI